MTVKLFCQAIVKFLLGAVIVGALLFIPAGGFGYANGWFLMGVLFVPMFIAGIVMMVKDPELFKKRLNAKERRFFRIVVHQLALAPGHTAETAAVAGVDLAGLLHGFLYVKVP